MCGNILWYDVIFNNTNTMIQMMNMPTLPMLCSCSMASVSAIWPVSEPSWEKASYGRSHGQSELCKSCIELVLIVFQLYLCMSTMYIHNHSYAFICILHIIIPITPSYRIIPGKVSQCSKVQLARFYESLILFGTILLTQAICEASPQFGNALFLSVP